MTLEHSDKFEVWADPNGVAGQVGLKCKLCGARSSDFVYRTDVTPTLADLVHEAGEHYDKRHQV